MKMIVGLGNPEKQYHSTRHNTGAMLLDWLVTKHEASWRAKPRLSIFQAQIEIEGEELLLVKPDTNYNNSGLSVKKVMDFYNSETKDILVVHDELVLPLGTIRTRCKGSDAGNNGLKSIISHIGESFGRIRIGIGQEARQQSDMDFVLSRFSKAEQAILPELFAIGEKVVGDFTHGSFEVTSYKIG